MKIGIITFNRAINYGAVLQAYALKNVLINMGYSCNIINYYCSEVEKGASPFYLKSFSPKDILVAICQIKMRIIKNKKFKEFSDRYLDTSASYSLLAMKKERFRMQLVLVFRRFPMD